MAAPLWLTTDERKAFDALPEAVRNGWELKEETLSFTDTPERRSARLGLVRLHDTKLLALREKVQKAATPEEVAALLAEMDLHDVTEGDLAELFFALGPDALTLLIAPLLRDAKTDGDLDDLASLLMIRHSLLESLRLRPE
ncbi:MAG: hypothetical protein WCV62_03475 [Candidatus Peribacteraceae bacterium]|jgi:hypothetical protein